MMRTRILNVAVLATALTVSAALAQQQQAPGTQRVSGTIERVDGNIIYRKGTDGSQKAVELRIFPRPQADGGHFSEGWPGAANGTMTNGFVQPAGTVGATFAGAGDPSIVVKYPQGEKRVVIPANAHVVRNAFGSKDDLKAGAAFRANAASKQPDGTYTASAVSVGRDGARPF